LGRAPTAHQRTALEESGYRCNSPGCEATWALEIDHRRPWSRGGQTALHNLQWLCTTDHATKSRHEQGGATAHRSNRAPP
ncbi:MAG: HNH endonuclease, partial [Actinobacteria bacterium]|nr:HNH endonuclease [Actinomycetota bacterium]